MDFATRQKAIEEETLSNDEALIQIYTRRDFYASADSDHSQALHAKILTLFEAAVLDAKKAVAAHEPVVRVLKKVLLDTGRLLFAAKQGENRVSKGGDKVKSQSTTKGGEASRAADVQVERESPARPTSLLSQPQQAFNESSLQESDLAPKQTQEVESDSAYKSLPLPQAARTGDYNTVQRMPRLTLIPPSEAKDPDTSAEQVQKKTSARFVRRSKKHRANAAIAAPDSLSNRSDSSQQYAQDIVRQQQMRIQKRAQAVTEGNDDANTPPLPPSRSVSPSRPLASMHASMSTSIATSCSATTAFTAAFAPAKRPPPTSPNAPAPKRRNTSLKKQEPIHQRPKKLTNSKELVVESEDSEVEMIDTNTISPSRLGAIDPSEGLSGFENLDEKGNYVKKPHARWVLENGKRRDALIVKLKLSQEKLQEVLDRGKKKVAEPKKFKLRLKAPPRSTPHTPTSAHNPATPSSAFFTPQSVPGIVSDDEDPAWESGEEITTAAATAHMGNVTFPFFPHLSAAHLGLFTKGLVIAIENIITDHADRPEASLLELVKVLEEEKPTLPGGYDERRIVLNGAEYVYEAVHQICGDTIQEKEAAKDSGVDADGDTKKSVSSSNDVKLTDSYDGKDVIALPEKAYYKGKGRAWKKTPEDADPDFSTSIKDKHLPKHLPKKMLGHRRATRGGRQDSWKENGVAELFALFRAHVKKEYWFQAGRLGVSPDKDVLPAWLWVD